MQLAATPTWASATGCGRSSRLVAGRCGRPPVNCGLSVGVVGGGVACASWCLVWVGVWLVWGRVVVHVVVVVGLGVLAGVVCGVCSGAGYWVVWCLLGVFTRCVDLDCVKFARAGAQDLD